MYWSIPCMLGFEGVGKTTILLTVITIVCHTFSDPHAQLSKFCCTINTCLENQRFKSTYTALCVCVSECECVCNTWFHWRQWVRTSPCAWRSEWWQAQPCQDTHSLSHVALPLTEEPSVRPNLSGSHVDPGQHANTDLYTYGHTQIKWAPSTNGNDMLCDALTLHTWDEMTTWA